MSDKDDKVSVDVPVKFIIRMTRTEKDPRERALLIAIDEKGREFVFQYHCTMDDYSQDLIVCDNT